MKKHTFDDLAVLPEETIHRILRENKGRILILEKGLRRSHDSSKIKKLQELQINHCYLIRESEIRRDRKAAHRDYLESLSRR